MGFYKVTLCSGVEREQLGAQQMGRVEEQHIFMEMLNVWLSREDRAMEGLK